MNKNYPASVTIIQTSVPHYRRAFYDAIYRLISEKLHVISINREISGITDDQHENEYIEYCGKLVRLPFGFHYQTGIAFRSFDSDIVVVNSNVRNLMLMILIFRSFFSSWKLVLWGHYSSGKKVGILGLIRLRLLRLSSAALFYTKTEHSKYRNFTSNHTSDYLGNGLNTRAIGSCLQSYDLDSRDNEVLFIGRLERKAQLDILLQAMSKPILKDVRLSLIGDGTLKRQLVALTKQLGISERVQFHEGTSDNRKIAIVANRCKLFCYPGDVGLSLIHGMSLGLPVVIHSDFDRHMPEIEAFAGTSSGATFERLDAESLGASIQQLISSQNQLLSAATNNLQIVRKNYDVHNMANRFVAFINKIYR